MVRRLVRVDTGTDRDGRGLEIKNVSARKRVYSRRKSPRLEAIWSTRRVRRAAILLRVRRHGVDLNEAADNVTWSEQNVLIVITTVTFARPFRYIGHQ